MLACHLPLSFLVIYVVYCRWVLTTTRNTFNSWPTPTQLLALFGHGLHPRISCLSLVMTYTQETLASHWSRPTPMQFLPLIGHGLHPRNSCLSLVTAYTHATLASHWSRPTSTHLLPLFGHDLHPSNSCLSLVTAYTHATLTFHWSRLTPTQGLFPESFRWFYIRPDVFVNNIRWIHRRSRWYITYWV